MTLGDFFTYIGEHPMVLMLFFIGVPALALLIGWISSGEGHKSPWNYLFGVLIYAVCIPGIFSVALSVYLFLFQRGNIFNTNVLTQIVPIISMVLTLAIVRRQVPMEYVPGAGKLSNLMMMIGAIFILMYLLNRTQIFVFAYLPVQYLLLIVVGLLLVFRVAFKNLIA
jgi:hypothetical protein